MKSEQVDSADLLKHLRNDPKKGISIVLAQFRGILHHQVGLFSRGPEEQKDLFQEVVLKLMEDGCRRLLCWREGSASFSTYLFIITRRICRDYRKKIDHLNNRQLDLSSDESWSAAPSLGIDSIGHSPRQRIQCAFSEAVAQLNQCFEILIRQKSARAKDRLLVLMRLEGYSAKEVGDFLGFSSERVDTQYSRIRKKLRGCMAKHGFGSFEDTVTELEYAEPITPIGT